MKRRTIAWLLAVSLTLSGVVPSVSWAAEKEEGSESQIITEESSQEEGADVAQEEETAEEDVEIPDEEIRQEPREPVQEENQTVSLSEEKPESEGVTLSGGVLEIVLKNTSGRKEDFQLTVKKSESQEEVLQNTLSFSSQNEGESAPSSSSVHLKDLQDGEYDVQISAEGYLDYLQTVTIEEQTITSLQVYTEEIALMSGEGNGKPGIMVRGDVNGDQVIDSRDASAVIDAIMGEDTGYNADLTGEGIINLADLQYVTSHMDAEVVGATAQKGEVPKVQIENSTLLEGNLEDVLTGENTVKIQPDSGVISESNPVKMEFNLEKTDGKETVLEGITIKSPEESSDFIQTGTVEVETSDGEILTIPFTTEDVRFLSRSAATAEVESDGTIVIHLGGQVAVKKITLFVTGTKSNTLAEISKVEFLNDMENRIPAPEMNIPENLNAEAGNKEFTVFWSPQVNVTGYEVQVSADGSSEVIRSAGTQITIQSFGGNKLENKKEYTVKVRSVNGEWKSAYTQPITVVPKTDEKPPAPDGLTLKPAYKSITVSWDKMKDTDSYNIYYRLADGEYQMATGISGTSYTLSNLEDRATYYIHVTGVNELGEGPASAEASAETASIIPATLPAYRLINRDNGAGQLTDHIKAAYYVRSDARMVNSPLDTEKQSALGVADGSYSSYYNVYDWDDGGIYHASNGWGINVELDDTYKMNYFTLAQSENIGWFSGVRISYRNAEGKWVSTVPNSMVSRKDENGRVIYVIKLASAIEANAVRFGLTMGNGGYNINVAEIRFYEYDSLEDDIMALYGDALHTSLKENVDNDTINVLQTRLDTRDIVSGEFHPEREQLQKELDHAKGILEQEGLGEIFQVDTSITSKKDTHLGFTGLNAWQPLGITAAAGETLVVYVGSSSKALGTTTDLQLVATQYHAEYKNFYQVSSNLKVGRNEITIQELQSFDVEKGGAVYIQYTGNNASEKLAVRVSGGVETPVLNLSGTSDLVTRRELIGKYVAELRGYVAQMEEKHHELHEGSDLDSVNYTYDSQNCILGTTDILLDQMMYSVSAEQLLKGLGNGSAEEQADKLSESLDAMDEMMNLFYQHKGLSNDAGAGSANRLPAQHLNIRYQRMFAGAFMYAAGNHIGIEWDSVPGLAQGQPIEENNGLYESGAYFGWGIAHEIGHCINQGSYAVAEVTNNYFSQLSLAKDSNDSVRFGYDDIYDKVTSGTVGTSSDVFTQLGMYWQLHLTYDSVYNYKTFDDYNEMKDSLFFARVDTYARNPQAAPQAQENGVALKLGSDALQNIMRLSCASAQKNLLEFFERWGLTPDVTTIAYAEQFEKEERAIYYVNDDAKAYRIRYADQEANDSVAGKDVAVDGMKAEVSEKDANEVTIHLGNTVSSKKAVLGYEIARYTISGGVKQREVVGFTTGDTFTDHVTTINNRVMTYEVTVIDQYLNRSEAVCLDPVKIQHDGSYDKAGWTVTTNMVSEQDSITGGTSDDPCTPALKSAVELVTDQNTKTTYVGRTESGNPEIVLNFQKNLAVTGFKYTVDEDSEKTASGIGNYEIQISTDGKTWTSLKKGTFEGSSQTVYFPNEEGNWIQTYDACAVKLIAAGQSGIDLAVSELDILGPTGDNVEFLENGAGILEKDYQYDPECAPIPAGSLVFTGTYKGNPAYNVVLLYDSEGSIVGSDETISWNPQMIILADVPEHGELGETSDGTWIYWIEPQDGKLPETAGNIRAELYRVDDAQTNEGQRLVSDSMWYQVPEKLPGIELQ